MAQHDTIRLVIAHPNHIIFLLAEAVIVIFLTLAGVSLLRSSVFRKALSRTSYGDTKSQKLQDTLSISISETASEQKPFILPRLRTGMSSKMTMGLKRLDKTNWLSIDEHYHTEHIIRSSHLNQHKPQVLQCLPGSEIACAEVLDQVSIFLCARYPDLFTISQSSKGEIITNHLTGERFPLGPENTEPLETAARLAMEDFNLLFRDDEGEYRLQASATLFPAGWDLEERIGGTMSDLHVPVPKWKENLGRSVNRYFDHLSPTTAMERHPLFIQTVPVLFQTAALATTTSSTSTYNDKQSINLSGNVPKTPADIHIRRERQTFTRLPISNAVLFTVHTFITPLTELDDDEVAALLEIAQSWSDDMAAYKGREGWLALLKQYAKEKGILANE